MDANIGNTAAEIKKYFYNFKRTQIGKSYSPAERFRKPEIWNAAAEKCIELKADPYNFTRAAFQFNNVPGGPFPHQLAGNAMTKWYRNFCRNLGASNMTEHEVTEQEVRDLLARGLRLMTEQSRMRPRDYFLDDYAVRLDILPAYIRVLLLSKDQEILKKWGHLATTELNSNPHLIDVINRMGYSTEFTKNY